MYGPEGAATRVTAWLTQRLPVRLRIIETRQDLPAGSLVDPARVLDHEVYPIALEDWPSVYVLPQRTVTMTLVDVVDGAGEVYRTTYAVRLLAWVRGDSFTGTTRLARRYALAIREALLERKTLTVALDAVGEFAVAPDTFREDYSDTFTDPQDAARTIGGILVDFNVTVIEVLEGPAPRATVAATEVLESLADTANVPPHPGL